MLVFVIRRVLISIPVLIASTILTFVLVKIAGDPLLYLKLRQPKPTPAEIHAQAHRLWLDRPILSQYWHWITNLVFHGNFGPPVKGNDDVGHEVFQALQVTARLVFFSIIIALILAIITGVISAVKQYSITDYTTTFLGFVFLSMPTFWFAILLKNWSTTFNGWMGNHFFPTLYDRTLDASYGSIWSNWYDLFRHMILPTIVLGLVGYASWSRFTRASMLEVLNSDYVRLAKSKGLKSRTVLVKHALRTALIPLTTVTALDIAALLGGAIVTETVFQWHGMGYLFVSSLQNLDFNVLLGWLLISAVIVIAFNLLADLLYGVLDPRIRHA